MSSGMAITCAGLTKRFIVADGGSSWRLLLRGARGLPVIDALRGIDLEVPKGQFVGIIGRNGAGKSTLLRVLGGAYDPSAGTISRASQPAALYELGAASNLLMSGRAYAWRFFELTGVPARRIRGLIDEAIDFSELEERIDDELHTYSAGMMARLFFAVATAEEHDLYLIDEILSVGDSHFQAKCWRRLRERLGKGASGVLVTHDWSAVLKLCHSAHVLDRGQFVRSGPAADVVRAYLDEEAPVLLESESVHFAEVIPSEVHWRSGEDAHLDVAIEVRAPHDLKFVFAVEKMMIGIGWEIVLNGIDLPIGHDVVGRRSMRLTIPRLPLPTGRYALSIGLVEVDPEDPFRRKVFDGYGWLLGRPIEVIVDGKSSEALLRLPMTWSLDAA